MHNTLPALSIPILLLSVSQGRAADAATATSTLDTARIEQLTGAKGQLNAKEGVFRVSMPRADLDIRAAGVHVTPPLGELKANGPSSWHPRRGTKSRRFRFVEVDRELADWIAEYRRDAIGAAPLFVNPTGRRSEGRWLGSALRQEWNRAARSLGIRARMYEGTKHSSASAAARYARLAPMASVTVLRPECKLSAEEIESSKYLETLGNLVGRAGIEPATSAV